MIAFAPFSNDVEVLAKPPNQPQPLHRKISGECTECNMLVLAFIAGVFLMAIFDALK
jgi:hypothetical protein